MEILKSNLVGNINIPTSKSYLQRFIFLSSIGTYKVTINNVNYCDDVNLTIEAFKKLGIDFTTSNDKLVIYPIKKIDTSNLYLINCGDNATLFRMLFCYSLEFKLNITLTGSKRLLNRVRNDVIKVLNLFDVKFIEDNGFTFNNQNSINEFDLPILESSQIISGFMISKALSNNHYKFNFIPNGSSDFINYTIDALKIFGYNFKYEDNSFEMLDYSNKKLDLEVPIDESLSYILSSFNYFNNNIKFKNFSSSYLDMLNEGFLEIDLNNIIDIGPILIIFSCLKNGAKFTSLKRLAYKESNRIKSIIEILNSLNIDYEYNDELDYLIVNKCDNINNKLMFMSHNDHRIAMIEVLLLSLFGGSIDDVSCISKSYPNFMDDLVKCGLKIN